MGFISRRHAQQTSRRDTEPARPTTNILAGRRHRVDVPSVLPTDRQEIRRLDFQHYALRSVLKGNYQAPLDPSSLTQILDVGCGTGQWARDMAEAFPGVHVTGIDIEPTFSAATPLPATVHFVHGNMLDGLPFRDQCFEYVHQRLLVGAIPAQRWPDHLRELWRVLSVNGWVELVESSSFVRPGPATSQVMNWWEQVAPMIGFDLTLLNHLEALLQVIGFRQITTHTLNLPLGTWGGHEGNMLAVDLHAVTTSFKGLYCSRLNLSSELFERTMEQLIAEWEHYHTTYTFHIAYGQKEGVGQRVKPKRGERG